MLPIVLALGAILAVWAMYKVIVYALPCLLGLGVASLAINTGAGLVGAILMGLATAVLSFSLARFVLAHVRSRTLRWALAAVFALPSAALAHNVGMGALVLSVPTELWRQGLAIIFALIISVIAFVRMTEFETLDW